MLTRNFSCFIALLLCAHRVFAGEVEIYPLSACYSASKDIFLRVEGREVPVIEHRVRDRLNCIYALFSISGAVNVELHKPTGIQKWSVSPASHQLAVKANATSLQFTLTEPRYVVATIDGTRVLILSDPIEPAPPVAGANIFNVRDAPYSADATGVNLSEAAIQKALDDAAVVAKSGVPATVFVPAGIYKILRLRARSNVNLYLAGGAVLRGSDRAEEYPEFPKSPRDTGIAILMQADSVENVRIYGRGTIDAQGMKLAGAAALIEDVRLKIRPLTIQNSKNVTVEGILARESTSWTLPFFHSENVVARRIKVINDYGPLKHSDGINLCAVRRGVVEDCFVHTTDDAFCAKGHRGAPTEDVVFRRLVAISATRGLKCGLQAYESMRNVRFEDVDVVMARDGFDLMHENGTGVWEDIRITDLRVENCERYSFVMSIKEGGSIRNVSVTRATFAHVRPASIRGKDDASRIEDVTFTDLKMAETFVTDPKSVGLKVNTFVKNLRFEQTP